MNMSSRVYNYPSDESELNDPKYLQGLDLTDINIIPHFDLECGNPSDGSIDLLRLFKEDSYTTPLYCIVDGSHVKVNDNSTTFYGEAYLIKDGNITTINK
jgi:dipeptidase E